MSRTLSADRAARQRWAEELARSPALEQPPTTVSGRLIEPLYTPDDRNGHDDEPDLGYPGQYPFTRGVHASMYRLPSSSRAVRPAWSAWPTRHRAAGSASCSPIRPVRSVRR